MQGATRCGEAGRLARALGAPNGSPWVHYGIRNWNVAETASKGPGEARDAGRERDWRREAAAARLCRNEPGLRRGRIVPGTPSLQLRSLRHAQIDKIVFKFDHWIILFMH